MPTKLKTARKPKAAETAMADKATTNPTAAPRRTDDRQPVTFRLKLVTDDESDVVRAKKLQLLAELIADLAETEAGGEWRWAEVVLDRDGSGALKSLLRVDGSRPDFM